MNTVISGDESEIHDEPHTQDRQITVIQIHTLVENRGLDAQTVVNHFDLTIAEVKRLGHPVR